MAEPIQALEQAIDEIEKGGEEAAAGLVHADALEAAETAAIPIPWPTVLCLLKCVLGFMKDTKDVKGLISCLVKCLLK